MSSSPSPCVFHPGPRWAGHFGWVAAQAVPGGWWIASGSDQGVFAPDFLPERNPGDALAGVAPHWGNDGTPWSRLPDPEPPSRCAMEELCGAERPPVPKAGDICPDCEKAAVWSAGCDRADRADARIAAGCAADAEAEEAWAAAHPEPESDPDLDIPY